MFKYIFLAILAATVYFVFFFDMQLTNQMIGRLFVGGISGCFVVFLMFQVRLALQDRIAQPIRDGILLFGFRV